MSSHTLDPQLHRSVILGDVFRDTRAKLSRNAKTDTAVVFVHGFNGHPVKTWVDFSGLVDNGRGAAEWASSDLFFFDYCDVTKSIDDSSDDLEVFLEGIYPKPFPIVQLLCNEIRGQDKSQEVTYSKLILVGHSEGAIIIRSCIAEIGKKSQMSGASPLTQNAQLILFAPALFGFMPTYWLGLVSQLFPFKQIMDLLVAGSPAAAEMRDFITLDQIRHETEELSRQFPADQAYVAHVVFGQNEEVVRKKRYFQDVKYSAIPGKNHVAICKPDHEYLFPLNFVRGRE